MTLKIFYLVSDIHNTGIHVQLFGGEAARDQALKLVMEEWLDVREKYWTSRPDVIGLRERLSAGDINTAWLWFEEECRNPDDMYQVHEEAVEVEVKSEPNCVSKLSPDGEHHGYWIQKGVRFRCYYCGFQFCIQDMTGVPPMKNIEDWKGSPPEPC